MKTTFIQDLQAGDTIDDIFVLAEKNLARKRNGDNYLTVTLCDRSGRIRGVMWDNLELIKGKANSGDYVRVKGGISEYKGALQFVVREMEACPADALDPTDFVPATTRDVEKMFARLLAFRRPSKHPI